MLRKLLAAILILVTFFVSAVSKNHAWMPISQEFSEKNHLARLLFLILGALLVYYTGFCWRMRWRWLASTMGLMLPTLGIIAFTGPKTMIHLTAFAVFLICGLLWLILFSNSIGHSWIAILTSMLILSGLVIYFIIGCMSLVMKEAAYELSPLGLYQKGFLFLFSAVAICMPEIHLIDSEEDLSSEPISDSRD